jgi:hypothetical protein
MTTLKQIARLKQHRRRKHDHHPLRRFNSSSTVRRCLRPWKTRISLGLLKIACTKHAVFGVIRAIRTRLRAHKLTLLFIPYPQMDLSRQFIIIFKIRHLRGQSQANWGVETKLQQNASRAGAHKYKCGFTLLFFFRVDDWGSCTVSAVRSVVSSNNYFKITPHV